MKFIEHIRYKDLEIKLARQNLTQNVKEFQRQTKEIVRDVEKEHFVDDFIESDEDYHRIRIKFLDKNYFNMITDLHDTISKLLIKLLNTNNIETKGLTFKALIKKAFDGKIIREEEYHDLNLVSSTRNNLAHIQLKALIPEDEMETVYQAGTFSLAFLKGYESILDEEEKG